MRNTNPPREQVSTCSVVIGAGPIGMYVANRLAANQPVIVVDADPAAPQGTAQRAHFLRTLGRKAGPISSPAQAIRRDAHIDFRWGNRVTHVDRHDRIVTTQHGACIAYRHLILALGAAPVRPGFAEHDPARIQTAYSQQDFQAIKTAAAEREDIVIIGAGLLAVELAARLAPRTSIRLCLRGPLLRRYVDTRMARHVEQHLRRLGVQIESHCEIKDIQYQGDTSILHARDGRQFVANRVILACGLRPRTQLAEQAGLAVADGIRVDHSMRTDDPHIHAVGDCAAATTTARGNVALSIKQADNAIAHLLGRQTQVVPATHVDALRRIGVGELDMVCLDRDRHRRDVRPTRIRRRRRHGMFALTLDHGRIAACQAVLPHQQAERLSRLATSRKPLSRRTLVGLRLGMIAPPRTPDPVICRCAGVRRSRIVALAHAPGATAATVANATGAGLHCGACSDQVVAIAAGRPTQPSWRMLALSLLALAAAIVAAGAPTLAPGDSVRAWAFKVYAVLSRDGIRQLSGYMSVALLIAALAVYTPRRRLRPLHATLWHVICGALALAVLPLHVLGGITIGAGINRILVELFVACVFFGVVVLLRRSLRTAWWLHAVTTAMLVAAITLHVVYIYQY